MSLQQSRRWCRGCERYTLHGKDHFPFGVGCLATLLTGCVFFPIWGIIALCYALFATWRCQVCGTSGNPAQAPWGWKPAPQLPNTVVVIQAPTPPPALPGPRRAGPALPPPPQPLVSADDAFEPPDEEARPFPSERLPKFDPEAIAETLRGCRDSVIRTYRSLPDWAQPIVWGLGIAAPIVSMMVVIRQVMR